MGRGEERPDRDGGSFTISGTPTGHIPTGGCAAIEIENPTRKFGDSTAVDGLHFQSR